MDLTELSLQVEDAAECFSWGPGVLRKWLQAHPAESPFTKGLRALADGRTLDQASATIRQMASAAKPELFVYEVALQLVVEGATPNVIRRRLAVAGSRQTNAALEAA